MGWIEAGLLIRPFNSVIKPYLLFQFYHGYGETLIGYDKSYTRFRLGMTFH